MIFFKDTKKFCTNQESCAVLICVKFHCDLTNKRDNVNKHILIKTFLKLEWNWCQDNYLVTDPDAPYQANVTLLVAPTNDPWHQRSLQIQDDQSEINLIASHSD